MTPEQKQLLFDNTARAINGASQEVLERHVANCRRADPAYGDGVARALKEAARPCLTPTAIRVAPTPTR
jgi:catalase